MTLAVLKTRGRDGIDAPSVDVEVHLSGGLPAFNIVGLPETAVRESRERVRSAIKNCGFDFPPSRITVNLAPADLPKDGGRYDLPIALGILAASGQVRVDVLSGIETAGELALSGHLRYIGGILPVSLAARKAGHTLIIPGQNASEAALVQGLSVLVADHLLEVCEHLNGIKPLPDAVAVDQPNTGEQSFTSCLHDIKGQDHAKRALAVAAAGGHNMLMLGPPGTGKTLLARCVPTLLPPMTETERIESAAIHSVSQHGFSVARWGVRPFRTPHHSSSGVALVGGGRPPQPGEVSLAHNGVLFLDELPEFDRRALEALREPLESGSIMISRAGRHACYPAVFQLIAAMNPCPCGYAGDTQSERCSCTAEQIGRYRNRVSGPLLDRIDLHIEVPRVRFEQLTSVDDTSAQSGAAITRIGEARERQLKRQGMSNARLGGRELQLSCALPKAELEFVRNAVERLKLSARAYHRTLKVARTIADLEGSERIARQHLSEAISYRLLDRKVP